MWRICFVAIGVFRSFSFSLRVTGEQNIPKEGGVILACNHPGGLDSFILGFSSPRQVFYMAKRELFNIHPIVTYFLNSIGAFPINRGARDISAISHSVELLQEGRVLGMFPEGTRNRGNPLRRGRGGAIRIALEADVPVVPVSILGIPQLHKNWYNPFKRDRVSVQFGEPIYFPAGKMEDVAKYTTEVMFAIARMMPAELRGRYAEAETASENTSSPRPPTGHPSTVSGRSGATKDKPAV